jgi:hypothetical protein
MSICLACGRDHPPVHHEAELCLPWAAVGHEVIDNEADLVATSVNGTMRGSSFKRRTAARCIGYR